MKLRITAPAKVNWTLEVLGRRDDGYHEIRSVLQTINLCDFVTLELADEISLAVHGGTRGFRQRSRESPEWNLAYRAARMLQERAQCTRGAKIELWKHIPIAAGLGGGSSDAAAVLRGLRQLWGLNIPDEGLASIAAELGSDVPFFVRGGTALASGRGEVIEALPDIREQQLVIMKPRPRLQQDKTASMYAALGPEHYTDGSRTERLVAAMQTRHEVRDMELSNTFECVLETVDAEAASAFARAGDLGGVRPHVCGSGPAFFFLAQPTELARDIVDATASLRMNMVLPTTLPAAEATAIYEQ